MPKLVEFAVNKSLGGVGKDVITGVFDQIISALEAVEQIYKWTGEKDEIIKEFEVSEVDWEQLDALEEAGVELQLRYITIFSGSMAGTSDVLNRRIANASALLTTLKETVLSLVNKYVPLTYEENKFLHELATECLGDLAYFAYYQFNLDKTESDIKAGLDYEVNVVVAHWSDSSNKMTLEDLLEYLGRIIKNHKPSLTLFEQFPELEDAFFDMVGPYAMDLEEFSDFITLDHVKSVVEEKITPQQLVIELKGDGK